MTFAVHDVRVVLDDEINDGLGDPLSGAVDPPAEEASGHGALGHGLRLADAFLVVKTRFGQDLPLSGSEAHPVPGGLAARVESRELARDDDLPPAAGEVGGP